MRFGVTMMATDLSMDVVELAEAVEARGLDSLWLPEHTHIPTSRRTPPPTGDAELAMEYKRTLDPLVVLAAAAARTRRITLGTGVMLPAQRDPIVTAKAVATLQNIADGRFSMGVGFGWNEDEMEDHGVDHATRRARTREHVECMRTIWEDEVASYEGRFVSLPPSWSWPKPRRRVPVLLGGGGGPRLFDHLATWADGWIPVGGAGLTEAIPRLREAVAAAGRDPEAIEVIPFGSLPDEGKLEHFARIGVTEVVMRVPSAGRDRVLSVLDEQVVLVERFRR